MSATLLWFRRDLRLADHAALRRAVEVGDPVLPVYLLEDAARLGAASDWWLHHSLHALAKDLKALGSRLVLRRVATDPARDPADTDGSSKSDPTKAVAATGVTEALLALARAGKATRVLWHRLYEPDAVRRDDAVAEALRAAGLTVETFPGHLLLEPEAIETTTGGPYSVYTPFYRRALDHLDAGEAIAAPLPRPAKGDLRRPARWPESDALDDWRLPPTIPWDAEFAEHGTPGEAGARDRLEGFVAEDVVDYATARDEPGTDRTSRLSPHLHFGEITPRQVWRAVRAGMSAPPTAKGADGPSVYLSEIGWREFTHHVLYHFPHTITQPLRDPYRAFPWREDPNALRAWQRGRTGYPLVDAGMRQLWRTGWMHNRVRMVVASFLVKDLLLPWRAGEAWFRDTLIDADLASNVFNWQWAAGCGADAAPYFRIFNPITQSKKFDPAGDYIRRWVPELAALPTKHLHAPWAAPASVLDAAGLTLGEGSKRGGEDLSQPTAYPRPIVDHAEARTRALAALKSIKNPRQGPRS